MKAWSSEKISVLTLVLLITGAIDSIRNLPTTALFGSTLIFFSFFAAIVFLIPVALVAAELSSAWSEEEGGIYSWVQKAFGDAAAFFTIWLQWINTIIWYPTILLFLAVTMAYLINPELANNKAYLFTTYLILFWGLTFLGLSGLNASAGVASFCTIIGMIIPMLFFIFLAILWVIKGQPIAIRFNISNLIPHWGDTQSWISLTAIITSFLGMELAAVHVRNIHKPQRNFPRAMFFSVILILCTMIFGSLAIAIVVPHNKISLVGGVPEAFSAFFRTYHLAGVMPLVVLLLIVGSLGGMINWIISPAKSLMLAANKGFLPHSLVRLNKHGVPSRILIAQAVLVTFLCIAFLLFPSINAIYWLFTSLSTELYVMMYAMMFVAAIQLKRQFGDKPRTFSIPGGKLGYYFTCLLGLFGCILTLVIGFFPPAESIDIGGAAHFRFIFSCGIVLMLLPAAIIYWVRRASMANKRA